MVDPVHSTAAEGHEVVSRTNKYGDSMPILRPSDNPYRTVYRVEHEGRQMGIVYPSKIGWFSRKQLGDSKGPHESKHHAVSSLFDE